MEHPSRRTIATEPGYRVMVRTVASIIVFTCLLAASYIYVFRVGIMQTYFPETTNSRDLMRIAMLVSVAAYFVGAIVGGKFVWFFDRKFGMKRLLGTVLVVSIFCVSIAPVVRLYLDMESERSRVRHDLDHIAIRDEGRRLLSASGSVAGMILEPDQFPPAIAGSGPSSVRVQDGKLIVGFGGGFGQFGLVIVAKGEKPPYGEPIAEGIAYFDYEY